MSQPYLHINLWLLVLKNLPLETLLVLKCFRDLQDFSNNYVWKKRKIIIHDIGLIQISDYEYVNECYGSVYKSIKKFEKFGMTVKYGKLWYNCVVQPFHTDT